MDTGSPAEFRDYTPDELSELYKTDPAQFNELAAAAISRACTGKSEEETVRLRQVQWFIDGQLRKGKTPLHRMMIMENIFYSRVFGADGELAHLMYSCNDLLSVMCAKKRIDDGQPVLHLVKKCGGS